MIMMWKDIRKLHKNRWNALKENYAIAAPKYDGVVSLDRMAEDCVASCRKILFPEAIKGTYLPDEYFLNNAENQWKLKQALKDHLILMFAYRFYCECFQPVDLNKCLRDVHSHTMEPQDWVSRKNFLRDQRRLFQNWVNGNIPASVNMYEQLQYLEQKIELEEVSEQEQKVNQKKLHITEDMLLLPPNWLFSFVVSHGWKKSPYYIKEDDKDFHYTKVFRGGENQLYNLTQYFAQNKFLPLLFAKETGDFAPVFEKFTLYLREPPAPNTLALFVASPMSNDMNAPKFTAITHNDAYVEKELPEQIYVAKETGEKIGIPPNIQRVFNNYLAEKHFHGFIFSYILHMNARYFADDPESRNCMLHINLLLSAVHLEAPFAQSMFVDWILESNFDFKGVQKDSGSLSRIFSKATETIRYWNLVALPILAEVFLWSVYENYNGMNLQEVSKKIMDSFAEKAMNTRCERMNIYRLVKKTPNYIGLKEIYKHCKDNSGQLSRFKRETERINYTLAHGYDMMVTNHYYDSVRFSADDGESFNRNPYVLCASNTSDIKYVFEEINCSSSDVPEQN